MTDWADEACPHDTNGDGDCGRPVCPHCGPGPVPVQEWAQRPDLTAALEIIEAAAASECEACSDGGSLWRGEDQPELYLHGFHDETSECESRTMRSAVDAGLLPIKILLKCRAGHDWYGEGCPDCIRCLRQIPGSDQAYFSDGGDLNDAICAECLRPAPPEEKER